MPAAVLSANVPGQELDQYLDHNLLPRQTRRVLYRNIASRDDVEQYTRRFFHGAVDHGKAAAPGTPLRVIWADIAWAYLDANANNRMNVEFDAVLEEVGAADIRSAEALALERKGGQSPPASSPFVEDPPSSPRFAKSRRNVAAAFALVGLTAFGTYAAIKNSEEDF